MPGIFNSIDGYTKKLVHSYFDENGELPEWFPDLGEITGYVESRHIHYSRFKHEDENTKVTVRVTPDDVFQLADGSFHIVDYKTAKPTKTQDELFPPSEAQLNIYAYIGQKRAQFPKVKLSLIYMEPRTDFASDVLTDLILEDGVSLPFFPTLKKVTFQFEKLIPPLLQRARIIYDRPCPPTGKDGCVDCERLSGLLNVLREQ